MDQIFNELLGGNGLLIAVGCCLLCVVGGVLLVILNLLGSVIGLISGGVEVLAGIIGGLPGSGCGCLLLVGGCGAVALVGWLILGGLAGCDTTYTNFCALLGR